LGYVGSLLLSQPGEDLAGKLLDGASNGQSLV
jgi:hypothetical protein